MRKFIQNKLKDQKGLTLIELLAVIVILAIIAAIAIPAIGNIIENSRVGAAKSDALNALAAGELFLAENRELATDGITAVELASAGVIEDEGSFDGTGTTSVSFALDGTTGELLISGVAVISGVTVTFDDVPKSVVAGLPNSTDGFYDGNNPAPTALADGVIGVVR